MFNENDQLLATQLVETIKFFNQKGWSPATSTNYSVRSSQSDQIIISRSGVDKAKFTVADLIMISSQGQVLPPFARSGVKSSAETEIHTYLYHLYPEVHCVLHTHSVLGTVMSQIFEANKEIVFEGFEIQKGLEGNTTHRLESILPIVPNSQMMEDILQAISPRLNASAAPHGFLISGHGLYSWGKDIATARRHIETYEFLLECAALKRRMSWQS